MDHARFGPPTVFADCRVVDVHTGTVMPRQNLYCRDGRIDDIAAGAAPAGVRTVDLSGMYLLPGLISCHTHLQGRYPFSLRDPDERPERTALRAAHQARETLTAGITTIRCVHEQHRADLAVRDAARLGWADAPRILGAGRALTTPGGHGDGLGCAVARGRDGFLRAAEAEISAGADHVKVFLTGGLARPGERLDGPQMTADEIAGAVWTADRHGTYVVAHAGGSMAIRLGLDQGVRSFEHAYQLDQETAARLAGVGAFLTPTLVVTHSPSWMRARGFDEEAVARTQGVREQHMESIRRAVAAGVTLVNGTDFPPAAREDGCTLVVRELELLVTAGLTPLAALRTATVNAARLICLGATLGSVQPGLSADLIAVPEDPTQSVSALRDIRLVVQRGEIAWRAAAGGPL